MVAIVTQFRGSATRKLAMALEPVAGQVYFSPECHAAYAALGFSPSPGSLPNGVQFPDGAAYFTSRGSVMGQVPGEVVAAAFAVFNPEAVVPAVDFGWSKVDAATICAARTKGAVDQRASWARHRGTGGRHRLVGAGREAAAPRGQAALRRIAEPRTARPSDGRHVEARRPAPRVPRRRPHGGLDVGRPGGDRGRAAHRALLGPPAAQLRPHAGLVGRAAHGGGGALVGAGPAGRGGFTGEGRALRESIEVATDVQCAVILDALGNSLDRLLAVLTPWGDAIRAAGGYPPQGPHDLAAGGRG